MKLMPSFLLYAALACLHAPIHSLEIERKQPCNFLQMLKNPAACLNQAKSAIQAELARANEEAKRVEQLSGGNYKSLEAVARIAKRVYKLDTLPTWPGWTLAKHHNFHSGEKDYVGIWRNTHKSCIFAIAGSNDAMDWVQNAEAGPVSNWRNSGHGVHGGFVRETNGILNAGLKWTEFKDYLNSDGCHKGIILTGHSLGGAVANLLAAYANKQNQFPVKYLYTFGAPSVSVKQLENPANLYNKCFDGGRFYNKDHVRLFGKDMPDIVPAAATQFGYRHPKLKVFRFNHEDQKKLKVQTASCGSRSAREDPGDFFLHVMAYDLHKQTAYTDRVIGSDVRQEMNKASPDVGKLEISADQVQDLINSAGNAASQVTNAVKDFIRDPGAAIAALTRRRRTTTTTTTTTSTTTTTTTASTPPRRDSHRRRGDNDRDGRRRRSRSRRYRRYRYRSRERWE